MKIRKLAAALSALAVAAGTVFPCAAEGDYGQGGIVWMIKDQWDHRNNVGADPKDELEAQTLFCKHTDVNITGNGQYEVSFEGYVVPEEDIDFVEVGMLGLDLSIDFDTYSDCTVTLDEAVIDGTTYTFNTQPELEDNGSNKVMKLKNAYGKNADTTPEMDAKPWRDTTPITIKFTVAGLDSDKAEDNPDEQIVNEYGSAPAEADSSAAQAEESAAADSTVGEEISENETQKDSSQAEKNENKDDGIHWTLFACMGGGAVVVIIVIALIAKKKT